MSITIHMYDTAVFHKNSPIGKVNGESGFYGKNI